MTFSTLSLSALLFLATSTDVAIVNLPSNGRVNLTFSPAGRGDVERRGTVSRVRLEIDRMQPPGTVAADMNTYVVWAVSPEGAVENIGELPVDNRNRGRFEATTLFDQFAVLVTAEPHYMVDRPGAALAYRNDPPRQGAIQRVPVSVELGVYEYEDLPPAGVGVPGIVAQARAALHIARSAQADRWAEPELRFAQVAIQTTEELLARGAPLDFIASSAHESVRRGQQAFRTALQNAAANEVRTAVNEAATLQREVQMLETRLQELDSLRQAASDRVRSLELTAAEDAREREILTAERDAAMIRFRRLEAELAEINRRQQDLENAIVFRVSDEFFDYERSTLTAAGREALTKVASVLGLWERPIRLGAPEQGVHIVRTFLAQSDVPLDRVVIVVER